MHQKNLINFIYDVSRKDKYQMECSLVFQQSWLIIKRDRVNLVNDFLRTSYFEEHFNLTNICLIPKTARLNRMTKLLIISLCNVRYMIISKVLCQLLKRILPKLISEMQSAFLTGRLISKNILITQEMFHRLKMNNSCKEKFWPSK